MKKPKGMKKPPTMAAKAAPPAPPIGANQMPSQKPSAVNALAQPAANPFKQLKTDRGAFRIK